MAKNKLIYDPSDVADSDAIGSYLLAGDDGVPIGHVGDSIKVNVTAGTILATDAADHVEDAAHVSGDTGAFVLAVRKDAQGTLADTDGDYAPLQVDASGRLRTITDIDLTGDLVGDDEVDSEDPLKIGTRATNAALSGVSAAGDKANAISDLYRRLLVSNAPNIGVKGSTIAVGNTAALIPAVPLAGRMKVMVRNSGSDPVWLGGSTVTIAGATKGYKLEKGASEIFELGEFAALYAIGSAAGREVELVELA